MTFQHYIITRFNISIEPKGKSPVCTDEYLDYRFSLFEQYCLPSVKGQTCQNFKWLVLYDAYTPKQYRERAKKLHNNYPNFIPCYVNAYKYSDGAVKEEQTIDVENDSRIHIIITNYLKDYIKQHNTEVPDFYVTTRLDSDDALHRKMVATIQQKVVADAKRIAYDFVYTYKYILNEGIVYRYPLQNGHFLTLVESSKDVFRSVLFCNHLHMEEYVNVEHIYKRPLQMELIHGGNVVNGFTELTIKGLLYALLYFYKNDFGNSSFIYSYKRTFRILAFLVKEKIKCSIK